MKEENYMIPKNEAVCWDEDCTCAYVYTTDEENILITHCKKKEIGSHLWLDIEQPKWSSLSPISEETHRDAVLQGAKLIKKLNLREVFFDGLPPLH